MIFTLEGRYFKAEQVAEISDDEFYARLAYAQEHPGQRLPFDWSPEAGEVGRLPHTISNLGGCLAANG